MYKSTYRTISLWCLVVLFKTALFAQPPGWEAPTGMANNMSVKAQIYLEEVEQNGTDNVLAAFVGTEVRGVATPMIVGTRAYYFLTVHSDLFQGEEVSFKVYLSGTDNIYEATETVDFLKNSEVGNLPFGFEINIAEGDDFPISLSPIADDSTLTGYPFATIALDDYLLTEDGDPVEWTATSSPAFNTSIDVNNVLTVTPLSSIWVGNGSVEVTATETGTANEYSASQSIDFTVEQDYGLPVFGNPPMEFVQGNLPAPSGDLNQYLTFGGPCTEYTFDLNFPLGDQPLPDWETPNSNSGTMSLVVKVSFGGKPFTGMSNMLAGFIDGEIAGVVYPQVTDGEIFYYLSLSNIGEGEIEFRYYDREHAYNYVQMGGFEFVPNGEEGSAIDPIVLDLAPIAIDLSSTGTWTTTVVDPDWIGYLLVDFVATDCKYADKTDETELVFAFNQCADQTISLPPNGELCLRADATATEVQWYLDGSEIEKGNFYTVDSIGVYHFEGLTPTGCPNIKGCPLLVTDDPGFGAPTGTSPPLPTTWTPPPFCGPLFYSDIETGGSCCPSGNVIYVDTNTPWNHDGSEWDKAFASLKDAMEMAFNCPNVTEVWVASGTYYPTIGLDRTSSFYLRNGLTIFGGFSGSETAMNERDMSANLTYLSGDIGTTNDSTDNSYHVVYVNAGGIDETAVLDGFVIVEGNADGAQENEKGGGLYVEGANPTIRNCSFMDNTAKFSGGAIFATNTSVQLDTCLFKNNDAPTGGAVTNSDNGSTQFVGCSFENNSASNSGGGVFNNISDPSLTGCAFDGNISDGNGGGVYNLDSSPDVFNCVFTANGAVQGAAIYNLASASPATINCTFYANVPGTNGGTVRNNTSTSPAITNCIFWDNTSEIVDAVPGAVVSYSIVEGGHVGVGNLDEDPLFVSPTDLRITPCSPAVDAGDNTANTTLYDFIGNDRISNANGTATIDLGAYEMPADLTTPCTWTGSGDGSLWSDPMNWADLFAPQKCRDLLIPQPNIVTVPDNYEALGKTLEVELGAELVTEPDATMDIGN